jgi:Helix-turn-helix domain
MSVQAIAWVLESSTSRLAARLVLLSIANHANATGDNAWPSIPRIAGEAHLSERQAQRAIKELCTLGELIVYLGAGPSRSNVYRVVMDGDKLSPPLVTNRTFDGDKSGSAIRINRPEPSKPITPPTPLKKGGVTNSTTRPPHKRRRRDAVENEPCTTHPDSGLTQWGTCWACYSLKYAGDRPIETEEHNA